jgi:hypothetical protein
VGFAPNSVFSYCQVVRLMAAVFPFSKNRSPNPICGAPWQRQLVFAIEARRIAANIAKLPDLLNGIAKPRNFVKNLGSTGSRLIVNNMARGLYLIGSKREGRVRAVQIVDRAGNSTTLRLKDYMSRKIQPGYTALPWQQDFMLQENDSKATKQTADK